MLNSEERHENAGRARQGTFNRSVTLHTSTPTAASDRGASGSVKKFYELADDTMRRKVSNVHGGAFDEPAAAARLRSVKSMVSERVPCAYHRGSSIRLRGTEDRVVVYATSLRGVRRTHEDCHAVQTIFRGFRVWVDRRDVVMDSAYKRELQSVLHEKNVSLPQVFIRGRHIGGAEAVQHLFETGELSKLLEGFPVVRPGILCYACGDARFVPCTNCSGSRKFYDEDEDLVMSCWICNENGLIHCPDCSG